MPIVPVDLIVAGPRPEAPRSSRDAESALADAARLLAHDEAAALAALERAYGLLADTDEPRRLRVAATAITALQTAWQRFEAVPRWVERLQQHAAACDKLDPWSQARVACALIGAGHLSDTPLLAADDVRSRLSHALDTVLDHGSRADLDELLIVGRVLLDFIEIENLADRFEPLMLLLDARRRRGQPAPLLAGRVLVHAGRCYLRFNLQQKNARYAAKLRTMWDEARTLAQAHGLQTLRFDVAHAELFAAVTRGLTEQVPELLDEMEASVDPDQPMRLAEYLMERTRGALLDGDADAALTLSADCLRAIEAAATPLRQRGPQVLARVWALTLADRVDEAITLLAERAPDLGSDTRPRRIVDCVIELLRALRLRSGADRADDRVTYHAQLQCAFAQVRALKWPNFLISLPAQAAQLAADALEAGIEVEFVQAAVRQRGLRAPSRELRRWPWPIDVHTLGGFALHVGGQPYTSPGKAQKKPLELLRCLAAGGLRGVAADTLAAQLWPESDLVDARASLKVTLARLRKLLGEDAAIISGEGRLSLDDRLVRVDTDGFERVCDRIEAVLGRGVNSDEPSLHSLGTDLLHWYQGIFLAEEPLNPWLLGVRQRLHARFTRGVVQLGAALARGNDTATAIALLESAAVLDPLAEDLHRQLLVLLVQAGEEAGAVQAYRRLRASLSHNLGVLPSPATQAIVAHLLK